jgi:phosphatidylserine/phosphatidylglycerophosphate/cardiolipin synthase-like enzyme
METIVGKQFPKKVIPLIEQAKRTIDIVVFDWRWYPQDPGASVQLFNQAIVRAVRRGVKVRAITNSEDIIKILKSVGVEAKKLISQKLVHAKLMILDNEKVIIGSHNYTQSAFQMNFEISVILDKLENISDFFSFFNNLYSANGSC